MKIASPRFALKIAAITALACATQVNASVIFYDQPTDTSGWTGTGIDRVSVQNSSFVFTGNNTDDNILIQTNQLFTSGLSYDLSFTNIQYGSGYNFEVAPFYLGFGSSFAVGSNSLTATLTRFGTGSALIYNGVSYSLTGNLPYLNDGNISLTLSYNDTTHQVTLLQTAGNYLDSNGDKQNASTTPAILFQNTFADALNLGPSGSSLQLGALTQFNGGYAILGTVSNITVSAVPEPSTVAILGLGLGLITLKVGRLSRKVTSA